MCPFFTFAWSPIFWNCTMVEKGEELWMTVRRLSWSQCQFCFDPGQVSTSLDLCFLLYKMGMLLTVAAALGMRNDSNKSPKVCRGFRLQLALSLATVLLYYLLLYSVYLDPLDQCVIISPFPLVFRISLKDPPTLRNFYLHPSVSNPKLGSALYLCSQESQNDWYFLPTEPPWLQNISFIFNKHLL